ncbi:hypothetical protein [Streptomyces xinghaiensis]|uniref:hypothetical protein n=1 Tax=Streptomyces xinghaiensis TaxID=1038928 RepID=UPI00341A4E18
MAGSAGLRSWIAEQLVPNDLWESFQRLLPTAPGEGDWPARLLLIETSAAR